MKNKRYYVFIIYLDYENYYVCDCDPPLFILNVLLILKKYTRMEEQQNIQIRNLHA